MRRGLAWVWVLVVGCGRGACASEVTVGGGVVRGAVRQSQSGREYHAFNAIPYAQPPVGKNRFMPTVAGAEWSGVLDATQPKQPCAQAALGITAGVEDCLNLYVYTPKVPAPDDVVSLPVVVWLHGGSFVVGGAASLDESFLMDRDIVLVIPQYRLGLLGFLATSTGRIPGNMGMLDQVEALRWVRDNIAAFGGNPEEVTLAGDCGGGAAAIYHMLSPLSQGLFQRVLSLSGSPLSPWALNSRTHRFMLILANILKCPAYDQSLFLKCLQELDQAELLEPTQIVIEGRDPLVGNHRLAPHVQKAEQSDESSLFLHQHPLKGLTEGSFHKVPVLMGVTRAVGSYLVDMEFYELMEYKLANDQEFLGKLLELLLKENDISDFTTHEEEFAEFYFPGIKFNNIDEILPGLSQMFGDLQFKAGILSAANLLSEHVLTRVLRFEYMGGPKLFTLRHPDPSEAPPMPPAVGHGDEMMLLLPEHGLFNLSSEQRVISRDLIDIVENYAYGRVPREDWPLFTTESQETLVLGEDGSFYREKFTSPEHAQMLYNIHAYHHHDILLELAQEQEELHDEL
nr:cocaine esterase-like [Procambarus clarkii]